MMFWGHMPSGVSVSRLVVIGMTFGFEPMRSSRVTQACIAMEKTYGHKSESIYQGGCPH
jgi:hypothetical protein